MKMNMKFLNVAVFLPLLLTAACDMSTPSQIKTGQIRISETVKTASFSADGASVSQIDSLARDYHQNGKGDVAAIISFQGPSKKNEDAARKQAEAYARDFKAAGIVLKTSTVAVPDAKSAGRAVVSYTAMAALPPEGCTRMTGYQGAEAISDVKDYGMGCETKTTISRMIVKSEDLLGGTSATDTESRRAGATVEKYTSGVKNEKIDSINASTVGSGG